MFVELPEILQKSWVNELYVRYMYPTVIPASLGSTSMFDNFLSQSLRI